VFGGLTWLPRVQAADDDAYAADDDENYAADDDDGAYAQYGDDYIQYWGDYASECTMKASLVLGRACRC